MGAPPPKSLGHPSQCPKIHEHKSRNLDDIKCFRAPAELQMLLAMGKETPSAESRCSILLPLWPALQDPWIICDAFEGNWYFTSTQWSFPIPFLLAPGGFHIENKEQHKQTQQISPVFLICKGKLTDESLQGQESVSVFGKRLVWFFNRQVKKSKSTFSNHRSFPITLQILSS